jgi:hypothetical protein
MEELRRGMGIIMDLPPPLQLASLNYRRAHECAVVALSELNSSLDELRALGARIDQAAVVEPGLQVMATIEQRLKHSQTTTSKLQETAQSDQSQ